MRGTYLNTATVIVGAVAGAGVGDIMPHVYGDAVRQVIGIATGALGIRMFIKTRSPVIPIGAAMFGTLIGMLIGIESALGSLGQWFKNVLGAGGEFKNGFVTTSIIFCVGPMTVLGCLEDGMQRKPHLLVVKSIFDGFTGFFFAASLGWGVLLSAGTVFVVQGVLTLSARPLSVAVAGEGRVDEMTACGGLVLIALGLRILNVIQMPVGDMLPGLILAPAIVAVVSRRGWYE